MMQSIVYLLGMMLDLHHPPILVGYATLCALVPQYIGKSRRSFRMMASGAHFTNVDKL